MIDWVLARALVAGQSGSRKALNLNQSGEGWALSCYLDHDLPRGCSTYGAPTTLIVYWTRDRNCVNQQQF